MRFKKYSLILVFWLISSASFEAAALEDYLNVRPFLSDFLFGSWSMSGSLALSHLHCVASADSNKPNGEAGSKTYPYKVKVENIYDAAEFYLYLDGTPTFSGDARLKVELKHRDVVANNGYETLLPGVFESHSHNGRYRNCVGTGDNSEITISIPQTELSKVKSGNYSGRFQLTALGGITGALQARIEFRASIQVTNGTLVRISSVDNMALGRSTPGGTVSYTERFCVYCQSTNYRIIISSPAQGSDGKFNLVNNATLSRLPYELYFVDSALGDGTTPVTGLPVSGRGDNTSVNCGGADNATISLRITEANLQTAETGVYTDMINLLVEPE